MKKAIIPLAIFSFFSCAHLQTRTKVILEKDYTCYQTNDIRVYFSYTFMFGLMCHGDSVEQAKGISKYYYGRIEPLFKYHKINGSMLYNEWLRKNRVGFQPVNNLSINPPKGEVSIENELNNYTGRIVKIFRFSEYNYDSIAAPNEASYYICCTPSISEDGWGAQDLFLVKIETKKPFKAYKDWDDLIKHCNVKEFKYLGFEL